MKRRIFSTVIALLLTTFVYAAEPVKILFVGNSFTYSPGDESSPSLLEHFKNIAESLNTEVEVDSIVKGGHTLKKHFNDGLVAKKLSSNKYQYVILQSQSIEALELPKCFQNNNGPVGRPEFLEFAKKLLTLIDVNEATPVFFVNWTYNRNHPWLQDDFVCLRFEENEPKAGQKWFGSNLIDYQKMLNEGFAMAAAESPNAIQSRIGDNWQKLINSKTGEVPDSVLYEEDGYHPTKLGSFFSAMVLARDILNLNLNQLKEHPEELDKEHFEKMKNVLMPTFIRP